MFACIMFVACESSRFFFFWLQDCDKSYLQNWETIFSMSKRFLSQLMCRLRWQPEFSPVPSRRRKNKTQAKGNDWFLGQLYSELAETHLKVARKLWKLSQHGNQIFLPLKLSKQKKRFILRIDTPRAVPQDTPEIPLCSTLLIYWIRFG